jgi:hypothetical protein
LNALCNSASGAIFPPKTTTVTCIATDRAGNTAKENFTITIFDAKPRIINVPSFLRVKSQGGHQEQQQIQWRRYKVQSFAAKDTAKERYLRCCKLDWLQ